MACLSRAYYSLLLKGALTTDRDSFFWLHASARTFHSSIFFPLLYWICRLRAGRSLRMAIRYRVQPDSHLGGRRARKAELSNVFLSDIDLSAWLSENFAVNSARLRDTVLAARRLFPFVGELETYAPDEWEHLTRLRQTNGVIYDFLRDLRKIVWMEIAYGQARHEYPRYKTRRSIRLCLTRLTGTEVTLESIRAAGNVGAASPAVQLFVERYFGAELALVKHVELAPDSAQTFSTYLGFKMNSLDLPPAHALVLFAICPLVHPATGAIDALVRQARTQPRIRAAWAALAQMEWIYFQASNRTFAEERDWTPAWAAALENELRLIGDDDLTRVRRTTDT